MPESQCENAQMYCNSIGEATPWCRPRSRVEQGTAQGFVADLGLPHLVDDSCSGNCPVCHGDCDNDDDCASGLVCYERGLRHNVPPGCEYEIPPPDDVTWADCSLTGCSFNSVDDNSDFCIDPNARHPEWVPVNSSFWVYVEGEDAIDFNTPRGERDEIWEYDSPAAACRRVWTNILSRYYAEQLDVA